ncbi:DNA alkylation repair protein [bacterium]|nr:DNA alkylation repair protein [bacterium]
MSVTLTQLDNDMLTLSRPERAASTLRFFKVAPGEYASDDRFIGISVPDLRHLAKRYSDLAMADLDILIGSVWHEKRFLALLILIHQFNRGTTHARQAIFDFYCDHRHHINNWDLVDCSARDIVGAYVFDRSTQPLILLADSVSLWDRRIAMVATHFHIKKAQWEVPLAIADRLIRDSEDLIQKAVGWMLREIGKRDIIVLTEFLRPRYTTMPRTMLRYAIEKFPEIERKRYLEGTI